MAIKLVIQISIRELATRDWEVTCEDCPPAVEKYVGTFLDYGKAMDGADRHVSRYHVAIRRKSYRNAI